MLKKLIQLSTPPIFFKIATRCFSKKEKAIWSGNYKSWKKAAKHCSGYDSDVILEKVRLAMIQVRDKKTAYERDSVLFDKITYSWPLLAGLMWVAAQNNNKLNVLDFGGSLGSTYFQNKKFLRTLDHCSWNIVEQNNFVRIGKKDFESEHLKFYETIGDVLKEKKVDVILISSVLQYLENPDSFINSLIDFNLPCIIFDRTSFIKNEDTTLTVQNVPKTIYNASYPTWFFNEKKFLNKFKAKYTVVAEFEAYVGSKKFIDNKIEAYDKGFILKKNN